MLVNQLIFVIFVMIVVYTIILFGFIVFLIPHVHRTRQLAFQAGLADMKANFDRQLLMRKLEIQEETLRVVSRELHDNIGQKIYLSKLYLSILDANSPTFKENRQSLDGFLTEAADDLHILLKNLSMDLIKRGDLPKAIGGLVSQLERTALYKVTYAERGSYEGLPEQTEIFLFRIFQEAINNIIRHAMASYIDIALDCSSESIHLTIRDNGKGFNMNQADPPNDDAVRGKGITNMIDRAALINAKLAINSQLGAGTVVDITVSLNTKDY